ncbi:CdaR family transcriptional regulator [Actinoallomurus sp. CA-150999]|uniref:CdaR family transcriptional regulator n=1 Tax=Actinoallomurus sp. CA-150999 TaxID=3239887 RepID=UPI003D9055F1
MSQGLGPGWHSALTPALAQEIAGDTSAIIGFNVLITDPDGVVIGSGDAGRIGSFHEASVEVMRTLQAAAHTVGQARLLRGVRPGVTLPIVIDGQAAGTVGITGAPAQVRRFGLVVQRQTEILLRESLLLRSHLLRERVLEDLVRDIAHFDADLVTPDELALRAEELGYDLGVPRTAMLLELEDTATAIAPDGHNLRSTLLRLIRETFASPQDLVAAVAAGRFAVFHRGPARPAAVDDPPGVRSLGRALVDNVQRRLGLSARVGVGGLAASVPELRDSYEDAKAALRLGSRTRPAASVHSIDELRVHQLLAAVPHRVRRRFAETYVAELCERPDWPVLRQTITVWTEHGFNLVRTAAALNIHRNTLVYRLDKIARREGDRADGDADRLALYLACVADHLDD